MKKCTEFFRFAYDLTTKVLPLFGQYFGIKFNLTKIDMVAVPDFGFSAMENWGLITFRLVLLLFKDHITYTIQWKFEFEEFR